MKAKNLLLTLSLLFVSLQFFGQGNTMNAFANLNTPASATGNQTINKIVNTQNAQAEIKSTVAAVEALRLKLTCDAISYYDEAIVVYNNTDPTQGAAKMMSFYSTAPELWSVKNGLKYSISFLGTLDSASIIPITTKAGLPGN